MKVTDTPKLSRKKRNPSIANIQLLGTSPLKNINDNSSFFNKFIDKFNETFKKKDLDQNSKLDISIREKKDDNDNFDSNKP